MCTSALTFYICCMSISWGLLRSRALFKANVMFQKLDTENEKYDDEKPARFKKLGQ